MFTVLKSGRESEHGLCEGGDEVGQAEVGVVGGIGGQARLLWTDLLLRLYNSSRIPLSLFLKPRSRRTNSLAKPAATLRENYSSSEDK